MSNFLTADCLLLLCNMKIVILLLFVIMLAATPVYMLDHFVMPQLSGLKNNYGKLADDKTIEQLSGTVR